MSETPATDTEAPQAPAAQTASSQTTSDEAGVETKHHPATDGTTTDGNATDGNVDVAALGGSDASSMEPGALKAAVDGADDSGDPGSASDGSAGDVEPASGSKSSRLRQLEREGEVAADFLETLLDIADLDGDIDVDVDGDRAAVAIVDSEEGRVSRRLVGAEGKVLEALQELTRLAVQVETGERSRLMLDVSGHRAERRAVLVTLAEKSVAEVRESGAQVALDPMSAFERKVVHDVVSVAGLVSESEGADPHRHVIILPA